MALVIEDGSLVANANSFVTLAEVREYAAARGLSFPASDAQGEVQLVLAADYMTHALDAKYKGQRTSPDQALSWPRSGVFTFGQTVSLSDSSIPPQVKAAQCQLALETGVTDFTPTSDGREVIKEKLDVIETEYAPRGSTVAAPVPTKALAILRPLLNNSITLFTTRA